MAFKTLKIICGGLAGIVLSSHLTNIAIDFFAPTPEQFAAQNNKFFGKKATDTLRRHSDIRVIESGSLLEKFYHVSHPVFSLMREPKDVVGTNWISIPSTASKILGSKTIIFMDSQKANSVLRFAADGQGQSDIEFSSTLFHELGHHDEYKKRGPYALRLPIAMREAWADQYSIVSLSEEFGGQVAAYTKSLRAINIDMDDPEHDTLATLFHPEGSVIASISDEAKDSLYEARLMANECLIKASEKSDTLKTIYNCFKPAEGKFSSQAVGYPINAAMRIKTFIHAYEHLNR